MQHIPVLRKEVLSFLRESDCNIADLTAGLGGHCPAVRSAILQSDSRKKERTSFLKTGICCI